MSASTSGAFAPFRHRAFTVLWSAALLSNVGGWMHDLAAGWLMTTLTGSPAWVSLVQAATTLPVCLLAIPAGTLADRMDRRALLIWARAAMLVVAAALGALVIAGLATPQLLLVLTFLLGIGTAVTSPAWQAILPMLVPRVDLPPAVALHALNMNIARAIGPAVGGVLIVAVGIYLPFFVNAVAYLAIIAGLLWWRPPAPAQVGGPAARAPLGSFGGAMLEGIAEAGRNPQLRNTLLRSTAFYLFGSCYWGLLPLVAREQLGGTARLYGILVGCIGAGAVAGALLLPLFRRRLGLHGTVVAGTWGTAIAMAAYGTVHSPMLGAAASLIAGASWIASLSSLNVAAQLAVPDTLRARGMALYTAVFYGCLAIGSIVWGQIATHAGIEATLLTAAVGAVLMLVPARALPIGKH